MAENGHYVTAITHIGANILFACRCGAIIIGPNPTQYDPSVVDKWVMHHG